jgi:hypothetical protein
MAIFRQRIEAKSLSPSVPRAPTRVRNHITANGDACLLQRLAKGVTLFPTNRPASPKSSSRPLRRSTP